MPTGNPIIRHKFTADPTVLAHDDTVYLYTGHDEAPLPFVSVSHATIKGKAIGVAVSDSPTGPFSDAIGAASITQDMIPDPRLEKANLDPTVLIEKDPAAGDLLTCWRPDEKLTPVQIVIRQRNGAR